MNVDSLADWWRALNERAEADDLAVSDAFQQLENAGLINRVVVGRYICAKKGCKLATVIRLGDSILTRTRDYKLAPGANVALSIEAARARNTIDGDRHWPGHDFDVSHMASFGPDARFDMNCRCRLRSTPVVDVLAYVDGVIPGHPGAPKRI